MVGEAEDQGVAGQFEFLGDGVGFGRGGRILVGSGLFFGKVEDGLLAGEAGDGEPFQGGFGGERVHAWEQMLRYIETMEKLVICYIHGYAVGGGLQLALACDIRVAVASARVGLPASKEGIIPGLATYRLARYVGVGRAKQLIYLGNLISAVEGERIGLLDHLLADEDSDNGFEQVVAQYAASFSAGGRNAKALLADCFNKDFAEFMSLYEQQQAKAVASPDFAEAQAAYREGRDANWQ